MKKISKGMILAAGLGTRMRPLTLKTPKPLLPMGGKRLIDYPLETLARSGIEKVIINLHHLGSQIKDYLGNKKTGVEISYSEEPQILGTGGGIKNVSHFFGNEDFVVMNCDVIFQIDIKKVIKRHVASGSIATMVIRKLSPEDKYQPVEADEDDNLLGFNNDGKYFYAGLQILSKAMLDLLPQSGKASCIINDGYKKALVQRKKIMTYTHDGKWVDIGDLAKYSKALSLF